MFSYTLHHKLNGYLYIYYLCHKMYNINLYYASQMQQMFVYSQQYYIYANMYYSHILD